MPAIRGSKSKSKTRRWKRDIDQIHADLKSPKHLSNYKDEKVVEDLPGLGQHYCVECARWFEGEHSLMQHRRGKPHKRRLRLLKEQPYTQQEAEAAIGFRTDNGRPEKMVVDGQRVTVDSVREGNKQAESDDEEEYKAFFSA